MSSYVSLSSPTFRLFLRTVLAGFLEESKKVYEKLIDRFGNNAEEAARDIWENRNQPLFKFVGREEVSKNIINYIVNLFGGEVPTVPKILGLLYSVDKGKYVPPDLDTAKIAMLKNVFRQITPEIKKKLISHFRVKRPALCAIELRARITFINNYMGDQLLFHQFPRPI